MRTGWRFSYLLLAWLLSGVVAVAAWAASGAIPSGDALLARYAPALVLHPDEELTPVPVDGFLADSALETKAPDGTWTAQPPGPLPTAGGPWRLDQRLCSAKDGIAATPCYAEAEAAHGAAPAAYGAVLRRPDRIVLQYWFFYDYNPYSPEVPQTPDFWQVHEGDWEFITVVLDATATPLFAGYSRHCIGARRTWAKVPKRGLHPIVYVALGSHANYFTQGTFLHPKQCWPKEALIIFKGYNEPIRDFTAAGQTISPRIIRVTSASPAWMRFPGTWGEDQYIHFPKVTITYGTSPTGPAFSKGWKDPVKVPLSWPRG